MPRNNKGTRRRRFDTRLSFFEIGKILDLTPRQKITFMRYMKAKLEGGERKSN